MDQNLDDLKFIKGDKPAPYENKRRYCKTKLSDDDVRLIRDCLAERQRLRAEADLLSNGQLAKKFGVSSSIIERIQRGNAYGYVS